jgi:hypothetical protein
MFATSLSIQPWSIWELEVDPWLDQFEMAAPGCICKLILADATRTRGDSAKALRSFIADCPTLCSLVIFNRVLANLPSLDANPIQGSMIKVENPRRFHGGRGDAAVPPLIAAADSDGAPAAVAHDGNASPCYYYSQ